MKRHLIIINKLLKISHIDSGHPRLEFKDFIVFEDNWLTEINTHIVNNRTSEKHKILDWKEQTYHKFDDTSLIQYGAASYNERKRSAIKVENQQNISVNDLYYTIIDTEH